MEAVQQELSDSMAERDNRLKEMVEELTALKTELQRVNSEWSVCVDRENALRQENSDLKLACENLQSELTSFRYEPQNIMTVISLTSFSYFQRMHYCCCI